MEVVTAEERFRVLEACAVKEPLLREVTKGHWAACHLAEGFEASSTTRPDLENKRAVVARAVGSMIT